MAYGSDPAADGEGRDGIDDAAVGRDLNRLARIFRSLCSTKTTCRRKSPIGLPTSTTNPIPRTLERQMAARELVLSQSFDPGSGLSLARNNRIECRTMTELSVVNGADPERDCAVG